MDTWVWFTLVGLAADIAGAGILVTGLIVSKERAQELGVTRLAGETLEANLRLPAVADRVRQSTRAKWGLAFLVLGFLLQGLGSLLSAS